MRRCCSLLPAALALALAGCGGEGGFERAPVEGTVTLNGQPLANAHVNFEPTMTEDAATSGVGSIATTDSQGKYELFTITGQRGAAVGTHRVAITTQVEKEDEVQSDSFEVSQEQAKERPELLPARYNSESELQVVVPADGLDGGAADLQLTTP